MTFETEKRLLQSAIVIACSVPLGGGLWGMLAGTNMIEAAGGTALDSHMRYLSGLLFGIGIGFLSAVPNIENQSARVRLLSGIVILGGMARLGGLFVRGAPGPQMQFALIMELVVTPALLLWQHRLAARAQDRT